MTSKAPNTRRWWWSFGSRSRVIKPAYRSIKSVVDAEQSRLTQMAAALSYRTIFGMIPVLMVSLVAIKMFASETQIESLITQVSKQLGLDRIAFNAQSSQAGKDEAPPRAELLEGTPQDATKPKPDPGVPEPGQATQKPQSSEGGATNPAIPSELATRDGSANKSTPDPNPSTLPSPTKADSDPREPILAGEITPVEPVVGTGSAGLDQWIKGTVKSISAIRFDAIGYVGVAMLIYAAISMMVEIEHCFNQIFRVPTGRSWTRRITHYWTLLTLGTLLLGLTFVVGEKFKSIMQSIASDSFVGSGRLSVLGIGYLTTIGISTLLFLFMYTVIPNTRVKVRPALVGALMAAILWETGKWGFSEYIRRSTGYQMLYGQIALLPLFLLWIYTAWLIVLLGLYVTYQLQYVRQKAVAQPADFGEPAIIDPMSIFSVLGGLTRQFDQGKSIEGAALAKSIGVYEPAVNQMLGRLAESGLVHRLRKSEQAPDEYVLSMPPERINAETVLAVGEELAGQGGESKDEFTASMRRARLETVKGRSLAQVLGLAGGHVAMPESKPTAPPALDGPSEERPIDNGHVESDHPASAARNGHAESARSIDDIHAALTQDAAANGHPAGASPAIAPERST